MSTARLAPPLGTPVYRSAILRDEDGECRPAWAAMAKVLSGTRLFEVHLAGNDALLDIERAIESDLLDKPEGTVGYLRVNDALGLFFLEFGALHEAVVLYRAPRS